MVFPNSIPCILYFPPLGFKELLLFVYFVQNKEPKYDVRFSSGFKQSLSLIML